MTKPFPLSLEFQIFEEELMRKFEAAQTAREMGKSLRDSLRKSEAALSASRRRLDSCKHVYAATAALSQD